MEANNKSKSQLIKELKSSQRQLEKLRKSEEILKNEVKHYKIICDRLPVNYQSLDINGNIFDINPAWLKTLGYSKKEVIGKNFSRFLSKDHKDIFRINFAKFKKKGVVSGIQYEMVRKNGEKIYVEFYGRIEIGEKGKFIRTHCVFQDITRKKESEEKFKKIHKELKIILDSSPSMIWIKDKKGKYLQINRTFSNIIGLSQENIIGKTDYDIFPKDLADKYCKDDRIVVNSGKPNFGIIERYTKPSGEFAWSLTDKFPHFDDKDNIIGTIGFARDITEKKVYENEIKKAKETAETYLNIADVILVAIDINGKVTLINKKGCNILGYKKEDIIGKNWFNNFLPLNIRNKVKAYSNKLLSGQIKPTEYYENPVFTKDGKERLIAWNAIILKDENGKITSHFSSGEDITDRRLAEEKLRKSEKHLAVALDSIGDGVIVADAKKRIILMNRVAQKITGWDFEDVKDFPLLKVYNVINNHMGIKGAKLVNDVLNNKRTYHLPEKTILITKNNTKLRISSNCAPILDKEKNIFGTVVTFRDITEEFALQEQLQQFRKMESIGQLAGGIAHDFNNLLGGIIGLTDLIEIEAHKNCPSEKYVSKIRQTAIRASMLTKQLLAFSRRGAIQSIDVNLHNIIDEVVDLLQNTIDKRIEIVKKYNAESPLTLGDPSQLQNAILNISLNARDAMPDGGKLSYYTSIIELDKEYCERYSFDVKPGLYIQVEISDTGEGIDKQVLEHIFEPFFTTKEVGKGTGLGLAAVYGIVKEHKGVISVYSEKGQGTVFKMYFKCREEDSMKSKKELPVGVLRGTGKILVVDDEEVIWSTAKRILTILGYDVMVATNGEEAIKIFRKHHKEIDLVILDMVMPKMNGEDTFREIKKINSKTRILISTGFPLTKEMRSLVNKGAAGLIQKPFIMKDFSCKVSEALKK